jgi:hypothetical protein
MYGSIFFGWWKESWKRRRKLEIILFIIRTPVISFKYLKNAALLLSRTTRLTIKLFSILIPGA